MTAGYDLSRVWRGSLEGRYAHFHVEDSGPISAPLSSSYADVGRGAFSVNVNNTTARTWGYIRAYSSYGRHLITDGFRSTDRTKGPGMEAEVLEVGGNRASRIRTRVISKPRHGGQSVDN